MEMVSREAVYSLLQQCSTHKDLAGARHVHSLMLSHGLHSVSVLADHLIRLFSSCHCLLDATLVFCSVSRPTVFTWHSLISAYTSAGHSLMVLHLFHKMLSIGTSPDKFIYTCVLKACSDTHNVLLGTELHACVVGDALESDPIVSSSLIHMYAKCGEATDARKVFSEFSCRNSATFNTVMAQCNRDEDAVSALAMYDEMLEEAINPERSTFSCILKACTSIRAVDRGQSIHEQAVQSGLELDVVVASTLIDMYVKCNKLDVARQIFDRMDVKDIVSWGAMISGYVQNHDNVSALQLFERMQAETESIRPNKVVFSSVLRACACLRYIKHARLVHHFVVRSGWESDKVVGSALIDVYAKCGVLKEAFNVFKKLQVKDVVSWNAIIIGYMQHGLGRTSLSLFARMMNSKVKPDRITFLGTLKACGMIGAVGQGKMIHHHIIRNTFESDITIGSALVDMYVKCGSLGEAHILSKNIPEKNIVSWGATIAGYAQQGDHVLVGKCLHEMARQGVNPNGAIYVNIFAACSHAGDVTKCLQYFNLMVNSHCIMPGTEHFNCMVDVLGRAGLLEEAKVLLQSMPIQADVTCWVSLLSSCQTYGELDLGRRCFNQLVEIDPEYASSYVLMYRMYADLNMWDYLSKIRGLRTSSCVWKNYDYKELR